MKPLRPSRSLVVLFGTGALALPAVSAGGAAASVFTALPASSTKTLKLSGSTVPAQQWGTVTVNVTMQTSANGKAVTRKFIDLGGGYTYHTSRSQFIMSQALPILRQEFLKAQSSKIRIVSGATLTSQAFVQSLQSALLKAHA